MKNLFFLLTFIFALPLFAQESNVKSVNVNGEGIVKVVPDQVIIKSRIEHEGSSATEVKKENDAAVNKIIKYLKAQGIDEKNIKTDYINLDKRIDYQTKAETYVANQAISIHLQDITQYETIMKGLLENGLNRIDGIQFKSSKMENFEKEARKKAVLAAKEKAQQLVEPLGQKLGNAISISESNSNIGQPMYRMQMDAMSTESMETMAPGEMEVKVNVNISFQLF
ncbi:SIMPL domain-containing protein [Gramella sp. AN32]|uniref:SIMPL domain-containing protein n=1 Tax=Christiangramia antarctica TaxID=2058158 RepID=A0ABW5X2Z6_9FLAO|nr:SIMPL domain-containing protein [Gramella sp. AN32]MCM4157140.1 SIMPL domain-containing protein [Gramella sp. AN32]